MSTIDFSRTVPSNAADVYVVIAGDMYDTGRGDADWQGVFYTEQDAVDCDVTRFAWSRIIRISDGTWVDLAAHRW